MAPVFDFLGGFGGRGEGLETLAVLVGALSVPVPVLVPVPMEVAVDVAMEVTVDPPAMMVVWEVMVEVLVEVDVDVPTPVALAPESGDPFGALKSKWLLRE
jgi:hypothetical protein